MLNEGPALDDARVTSSAPVSADQPLEIEPSDAGAVIGPNAVLQSVHAMRHRLGESETRLILDDAQISALPSGEHMIPEIEAIRLHRWLNLHEPVASFDIAEDAGARTADYIIANRIPKPAVWLLERLPAALSALLLMHAIRRHAWTFIGAGAFEPHGAWRFAIDRSQADDAMLPPDTLFHWYAAVFTRLYQRLVRATCECHDMGEDSSVSLRHEYSIVTR